MRDGLSEKDQKLVSLVLKFKDQLMYRRWLFEREWYRNILFYLGQQWITYDDTARRWRKRNMQSWIPLPVTNRLASTVNVIRSSVAQVNPAFDASPTQDNEKSVLSANAADKYLDILQNEAGFRGMKRRLASWITLTGNGFIGTDFDTSAETGTVFIPGEVCRDCQTVMSPGEIPEDLRCPSCGSDRLQETPDIGVNVPQGRLTVRAYSPFEVYVDQGIMELEDQPAILIVERKPIETIKSTYGKAADDVSPDMESDVSRWYLESISTMTGSGFGSGGNAIRQGSFDEDDGPVTLYRLYVKTCKEYPEGAYIAMSGDQHVLEAKTPYPFFYKTTKKPFYPYVHVRYDDVPGRFWAKTPIDDLVPKQRQRNEMESLYQTIIMRCANPVWLVPVGVQTSPITGDPAIQVRYTGAGGLKPERLPGLDAPVTVLKFIEQIDADFEEIANTFAVLKGKNPGSVRAASAIQMLIERGFGRYGSVFDNLEEAYETWGVQALEIWRQRAVFPRVQAISQTAGSWQFMEFSGADLGDIDIRVEAGSTRPKSQAGRQLLIGQMLQWGLLNPNDPEQRMKIFEEMGAESLLPGAEADIKVVAEENATFMSWAQQAMATMQEVGDEVDPNLQLSAMVDTFPLEANAILDHHPTHLVHHRRFALGEAFRSLPKAIQQLFVQHMVQGHYIPMLQEIAAGVGPTGLVAGALMQQQQKGNPNQSVPSNKQPSQGKGPGGAESPFGSRNEKASQTPY